MEARSHGVMLPRVRTFSHGRVAGRDRAKAERLAADLAEATGVPFEASTSFAEAVQGADVVCATTHATEPVVRLKWLSAVLAYAGSQSAPQGYSLAGSPPVAACCHSHSVGRRTSYPRRALSQRQKATASYQETFSAG